MNRFAQAAGIISMAALAGCGHLGVYKGPPQNSVRIGYNEIAEWRNDVNRQHLRDHFRSLHGPDVIVVYTPTGIRIYHSHDRPINSPWNPPRTGIRSSPNPLEGLVGYTPRTPRPNTPVYTPPPPRTEKPKARTPGKKKVEY